MVYGHSYQHALPGFTQELPKRFGIFCGVEKLTSLMDELTSLMDGLLLDWGGLNVIDPLEKSYAFKLCWVPRVGDPSGQTKWLFFTRCWIGFPLSHNEKLGSVTQT